MHDPQAIADAFSNYYSSQYKLKEGTSVNHSEVSDIQTFLDSVHLPSLSPEQLKDLNTPFYTLEVSKAIDSLTKNKAPGQDGFVG